MPPKNHSTVEPKISECYLYWTFQQRNLLKSNLFTREGYSLKILHPGIRNPDNGPDYLNALLIINNVQVRGDIEFHLRWQDWFSHGHHNDLRYQRVILHVLFYGPDKMPESLCKRFSHFVISNYINMPIKEWVIVMEKLQSDRTISEKSSQLNLPDSDEIRLLSWRRFTRKCDEIRAWVNINGWETSLYIGLARALGYSKNSQPFMTLVKDFPPNSLIKLITPLHRSPLIIWILLAEHSGLLDRPLQNNLHFARRELQKVVRQIYKQFESKMSNRKQSLIQWNFSRLRPNNNPYFRLAGISQLIFHYQNKSLFGVLLENFVNRLPLRNLLINTEFLLCLPLSPAFHPFLKELLGLKQIPQKTMGKSRCRNFVLNILIPMIYTWAQKQRCEGFQFYLEDIYYNFPLVENNHTLKSISNMSNTISPKKAYLQQGLIEYLNWQSKFPH